MISPDSGVVQGSKISGTFYNLYVKEIPDLHKLIYDPMFKTITNKNTKYEYKGAEHETHNYIDDSNNVIIFKDHSHIKHYLEDYYTLIHEFYTINKLKINLDKTKNFVINNKKTFI